MACKKSYGEEWKMKILVTGGAGFIGSHVVDGYIREGHEVVVVDNLFTGKINNINAGAKFYLLDIRSETIREVFEIEKPDIVNHHAAQMSVPASVEDPFFDADVNIKGILNLLENSVRYGVEKLIFISTGGAVYGETDNIPTPESVPPQPLSPYAITKLASENYLRFYRFQHNLHYTILRYANIYGPRQVPHAEAGVVSIFMNKLKDAHVPTLYHYPEEPDGMTRDYCYVGDIAQANILALKKGSDEVINIGTSRETSTGELYRKILSIMRSFGYALDARFDSPQSGPARPSDLRRSALNTERSKSILQWEARYDVSQGLEETIKQEIIERIPAQQ
jgi:UDP-glucose 4-epimerase